MRGHDRNAVMVQEATHFIGVRNDKPSSPGTDNMAKLVQKSGKPLALYRISS
jgi:hypothetical protein